MVPLVTVITVVHNAANVISHAIDSVLSQDHPAIELIVVDGASTDGTLEILKSYGDRIAKLVSERDGGIYFAMNRGLDLATGNMILFMNSDDHFADSRALSSLVAARAQFAAPGPVICYSDFKKYYPSLERTLVVTASLEFQAGMGLCHQAMLVDRSAYELTGQFQTVFRFAADHDWVVRAHRLGVRFVKSSGPPAVVFRHGGASDSQHWSSRAESAQVILREYGTIPYIRFMTRQIWILSLRNLSKCIENVAGPDISRKFLEVYFLVVRRYRPTNGPRLH